MLTLSNFRCERCGDCCRYLTVKLSKEDISAIKEKGFEEGFFVVFDDFIKSEVLKRDDKGCVFFDGGSCCKIYDFRPTVCKRYPFVEYDKVESCKPKLMKKSRDQ